MRCIRFCLLFVLVPAATVNAQTNELVRLEQFSPVELRSAAFVLSEVQAVVIRTTGADAGQPVYPPVSNLTERLRVIGHGHPDVWRGNAWILDAATRQKVWELRNASVVRDGVLRFDGSIPLPAGTYELYYSAQAAIRSEVDMEALCGPAWRSCSVLSAPRDHLKALTKHYDDGLSGAFGIVVSGIGRPVAVPLEGVRRAGTLVSLAGVRANDTLTAHFKVDRPTRVVVEALGEMYDTSAADYGLIMNADTHQPVWSFTYRMSLPAGGAGKNRRTRQVLELPPGSYTAVYRTDESHQPGDWNEAPPYDPRSWGMSITLAAGDGR